MIEGLYQEENKKQKEKRLYIYIYGGEFDCAGAFMIAVV
jgi:hypothetical protein